MKVSTKKAMDRRSFLRGAGAAVLSPVLANRLSKRAWRLF